jgi:peptide/nickel transport system substrate-binding protein
MKLPSVGTCLLGLAAGLAMSASPIASTSARAAATPQRGGDLVIVRSDPLQTLLPSQPTDNASIWVIEEVFDTLLVPKADGLGVAPDLATSWTQSADGLTWTFSLAAARTS